jgi:hypothetical protein
MIQANFSFVVGGWTDTEVDFSTLNNQYYHAGDKNFEVKRITEFFGSHHEFIE